MDSAIQLLNNRGQSYSKLEKFRLYYEKQTQTAFSSR